MWFLQVPIWFWSDYANAAGVFQIGEVFNGGVSYVAQYQGALNATLNYPLYFTLSSVRTYSNTDVCFFLTLCEVIYPECHCVCKTRLFNTAKCIRWNKWWSFLSSRESIILIWARTLPLTYCQSGLRTEAKHVWHPVDAAARGICI